MKQKLVIVSRCVHDPEVLVIDEPMVGLDALAQKRRACSCGAWPTPARRSS